MPEDLQAFGLPPFRVWERGGARPVLALHCSLAHSGAWSGLAARLSRVTISATDQPSHGRAADWDGKADLHEVTTRASIAMAEEIGGGRPVDILGHSFGGTVALRIALERPDLVRSLVLVEPVIFAAARAADDAAYAPFRAAHLAFSALVKSGQFEAAAAMFHGIWGTGEPLADLPARSRNYMVERIHLIAVQNPVLLEDGAGLLRDMGLEAVGVPVLLIEGALSPPIIPAVHGALARRLPMAARLAVPGAGHMVPITHAEAVAVAVQAHLDAC
jgi:lipase